MSAFTIDAFEFCRQKERREGEFAVSDLTRLATELANASGTLKWSVQGGRDSRLGHPQLTMSVSGQVQLICQRCLTPFAFPIATESTLILAPDEASANEIEALLDDESVDVIVGSRQLDLVALVEDDALLALPLAPKHEVCPDQAQVDAVKAAKEESPFAVLKNLKK